MKCKDQQLLEEAYQRILLNEKGYDEAWELFHLKDNNVTKMIRTMFGFDYKTPEEMDEDVNVDILAKRLGSFIDRLPVVKLDWNKIPQLKEMDPKWIKAFQSIQNTSNVEQETIKLMYQRDSEGPPRPGGKKRNEDLLNDIKNGLGDPVVLLEMPSASYAVGGRTRMYAALATRTNIKAIILTPKNLQEFR